MRILGMAPAFFKDPFGYATEIEGHGHLVQVPFPTDTFDSWGDGGPRSIDHDMMGLTLEVAL